MEVVDIQYIGSNNQYQNYSSADLALINTVTINASYGGAYDYIEYFIKDQGGLVLSANYYATQYNVGSVIKPTTGTTSTLYLDPEADVKAAGYDRGNVNIKYNFFTKWLASSPSPNENFWIKQISSTRTEIKTARQDLSNLNLLSTFNTFNNALAVDLYYPNFYLNFGNDKQLIAVNAVYSEEVDGNAYIIFKLYEPLPNEFDIKSTFWVVTEVADSAEFNVNINAIPETLLDSTPIKGPNFKVQIKEKVQQTTPFYSYETLLATALTSSYQQLQSMMQEQGIDINVDYGNFKNFVHYSSATNRLHNFVYKIQQIESASSAINEGQTTTTALLLQQQIDNTITNFDGYEYYLYFTSASTAWPKQNNTIPYVLYPVTSSQVVNWLGNLNTIPNGPTTMSMYYSSSYYDDQNKDWLVYATPSYITEDSSNEPYILFLNMVGQMFDNIWIYLKDVTNHYVANNNPDIGISKQLVADALRSFGIQLYTNTSISDNIYYSTLGINQTGSSLPVTSSLYSTIVYSSSSLYPLAGQPYLTASLSLPPFGEELINRFVTSFVTESANVTQSFATLPASEITAEIYKRIYHNLPYLLKTRGTNRGLQALVTTYGIPDNILTVHEYGGYDIYTTPGIQEIASNKIITSSVQQISASLLSPNVTLQYYNNDYDKSSVDVEVAFSPADSINAAITSSGIVTSSAQPGYFNIMQQIGAPNLQYSSSYTPLVALETEFFNANFINRNNVWDFIRTIKYYNNSLFKMLRDFVPARVSADTGIVIKSHMLERNKYPRHEPTYTTSSHNAELVLVTVTGSNGGSIAGSTAYLAAVPVQYNGTSSMALSGAPGVVYMNSSNNIQQFTGELSGSYIQATTNYFTQKDISSYSYPWTSSVKPSEHNGQNVLFLTYSLSPLFENVMSPVRSQRFLELDYNGNQLAPTNYGLITQSLSQSLVIGNISQSEQKYSQYAYIQDYNYYSRGYVNARYSGSQLSGLYYNNHSTGDTSYGNQPVINLYSDNLGFFTQIQSSSFIPGTVNASLAYLADVSGGLSELNQNNKRWIDIQNIFVQGNTLTVKQFDNKKYSNQVATDGVKTIYNSGYNYTPELYFNTSSDSKVYFQYNGAVTGETLLVENQPNFAVSGSASPRYLATNVTSTALGKAQGYIYDIFDTVITDSSNYYITGSSTLNTFPTFSVPYAGVRSFTSNLNVNLNFPRTAQEATYSFTIKNNGGTVIGSTTQQFKSNQNAAYTDPGTVKIMNNTTVPNPHLIYGPYVVYGPFEVYNSAGILQGVSSANSWISASSYSYTGGNSLFAMDIPGTAGPYYDTNGYLSAIDAYTPGGNDTYSPLTNLLPAQYYPATDNLSTTLSLNLITDATSFSGGDKVTFELQQTVTASNANFTASVSVGSLSVVESATTSGNYPYVSSSTAYISRFYNDGVFGNIVLNPTMSSFVNYQQVPYFVSGSPTDILPITASFPYSSSLYNKYGDINATFSPQTYDKVILTDVNGLTQDLNVYTASFSGSNLVIQTIPSILPNWVNSPSSVQNFLLLSRYDDEQNVIVSFTKPPGATSYGFLIPQNINPSVTQNINTLQAAVQSQLLSNQAASSPTV